MKQIAKTEPPAIFVAWVKRAKPRSWDDIHQTKDTKAIYDELIAALRREQGNLCCYCEQRLQDGRTHIEHFHERSRNPKKVFDYTNLHASCNGDQPENRNDKHSCGHKRQNIPQKQILSPLLKDVEKRFSYNLQGELKSTTPKDEIVQSTIDSLGLNCPKLVRLRNKVYSTLLLEQQDKDETAFAKLIRGLLMRDSEPEGGFTEFWTVVDYFFGSRTEEFQ